MPDWKIDLLKQLESLGLSPVREAEIVSELAEHLESRYEELLATGVSPAEAERITRAELSQTEQLARELRAIEKPAPSSLVDSP